MSRQASCTLHWKIILNPLWPFSGWSKRLSFLLGVFAAALFVGLKWLMAYRLLNKINIHTMRPSTVLSEFVVPAKKTWFRFFFAMEHQH